MQSGITSLFPINSRTTQPIGCIEYFIGHGFIKTFTNYTTPISNRLPSPLRPAIRWRLFLLNLWCSFRLSPFLSTGVRALALVSVQLIHSPTSFSAPFYIVVVYAYCHGILGHSGVNFKSFWWQPWQPDTIFHDNHHQYFHVNFAFNIYYWDILHGTYRQKDRVYSEHIFYGRGKKLDEVSKEVLQTDIVERNLENPQAYRNSLHRYKLDQKDLRAIIGDNKIETN